MTETEKRVKELTEQLEAGVKDVFASGKYAEYLSVMARFHTYSFNNAMLIFLQCPHASLVAGYRKWQSEFGRQVKKGERGIRILAPCPYTRLVETERENSQGEKEKDLTAVTLTRFKPAAVFDVSQTEGKELPSLISTLTDSVGSFQQLYDRLITFSPMPVTMEDFPGSAKGYCSYEEQKIVVRSGMSESQTLKTLVHEIAHAILHDSGTTAEEKAKLRREREVEAESVAYVVCQHLGIDTSDYSLGYVASWSRDRELNELKASLERIHTASVQIISAVSPPEKEVLQRKQKKEKVKSR